MPTQTENVQYLYLVLTNDGPPTIDWEAVGGALDLKKSAVTKRWSRLKKTMDKDEVPSSSTYQFLWLCVKHSKRDKPMNWDNIAEQCDTTSAAASKRYSRMKQAFEEGVAPPGVSPKATPSKPKATPKSVLKKPKVASPDSDNEDNEEDVGVISNPSPKRKRPSPKKKTSTTAASEQKFKSEPEDDDEALSDDDNDTKAKRVKKTMRKVTPKPKAIVSPGTTKQQGARTSTTEATTLIKGENDDDDAFHDAQEEQAEGEHEYVDEATAARKDPSTSPSPRFPYTVFTLLVTWWHSV